MQVTIGRLLRVSCESNSIGAAPGRGSPSLSRHCCLSARLSHPRKLQAAFAVLALGCHEAERGGDASDSTHLSGALPGAPSSPAPPSLLSASHLGSWVCQDAVVIDGGNDKEVEGKVLRPPSQQMGKPGLEPSHSGSEPTTGTLSPKAASPDVWPPDQQHPVLRELVKDAGCRPLRQSAPQPPMEPGTLCVCKSWVTPKLSSVCVCVCV